MKSKEIRDLSPKEIEKKIREIGEELVQLRVRKQVGNVEKPSELRELRRDIARLKSILREKQLAEAVAS